MLKPLGDRVVIRVLEQEEKTASGIFLPDTAKEKPSQGEVIAVGPGKLQDDGKRVGCQSWRQDYFLQICRNRS